MKRHITSYDYQVCELKNYKIKRSHTHQEENTILFNDILRVFFHIHDYFLKDYPDTHQFPEQESLLLNLHFLLSLS